MKFAVTILVSEISLLLLIVILPAPALIGIGVLIALISFYLSKVK